MNARARLGVSILCSAMIAAACSFPPKHEYQMAPGQAYDGELRRVLLIPINEAYERTKGFEKGEEDVFALMKEFLEAQGLEVETLGLNEYREAAKSAFAGARRGMRSGETSVAREVRYADTIPYILSTVGSDASLVIVSNMMMRTAEWRGRSLRWDGVRRKGLGTINLRMSGGTTAASLHVAVYTRDGSRVFSGYGGLDLLWGINQHQEKMELISDRLENPEHLEEGICVAFYPYFGEEQSCR